MSKQKGYKKVYEDGDRIKGSVSGKASKDDIVILERAVLEGNKKPEPIPAGKINIKENGEYDVAKYASANVDVAGMIPSGELAIDANGIYDVADKASVNVGVPVPPEYIIPEGTKEIRANGEYDIKEFEMVNIDVPGATTKELFEATANGTYDIAEYANVKVEVPNPSVGVLDIVANGEYDVAEKAGVNVNVPNPSAGVLNIDANGEYDVTEKAAVNVDVPNKIPEGYVKPEGSYQINRSDLPDEGSNTIDVAEYAEVKVPSISDLCEGTLNVEYGQYSTFNVAGYSYVDVRLEGNPRIADDNLSAGYYYADGSDYDGIYVESSYCFHEIGDPTFSIPKNSGKLFVYVDENAWYGEAEWPNNKDVIDQSGEIENIWGLGVGEETAEFSVSGRSFKIVRTK